MIGLKIQCDEVIIFPVRGATAVTTDDVVMPRIHVAGT